MDFSMTLVLGIWILGLILWTSYRVLKRRRLERDQGKTVLRKRSAFWLLLDTAILYYLATYCASLLLLPNSPVWSALIAWGLGLVVLIVREAALLRLMK